MQGLRTTVVAIGGITLGIVASMFYLGQPKPLSAASNDRYQDYIMATGAVSINPRVQTDGVWLLDYRAGKLLGTVIDKSAGKIVGFAEVDLASEFSVEPRQDVHFMMTTGYVTQGQSALYLAETTTGKFGVYTMGPGTNGSGIVIRRHDMSNFRASGTPAPQTGVFDPAKPIVPAVPGMPAAPGAPAAVVPTGAIEVISPAPLPPVPAMKK